MKNVIIYVITTCFLIFLIVSLVWQGVTHAQKKATLKKFEALGEVEVFYYEPIALNGDSLVRVKIKTHESFDREKFIKERELSQEYVSVIFPQLDFKKRHKKVYSKKGKRYSYIYCFDGRCLYVSQSTW